MSSEFLFAYFVSLLKPHHSSVDHHHLTHRNGDILAGWVGAGVRAIKNELGSVSEFLAWLDLSLSVRNLEVRRAYFSLLWLTVLCVIWRRSGSRERLVCWGNSVDLLGPLSWHSSQVSWVKSINLSLSERKLGRVCWRILPLSAFSVYVVLTQNLHWLCNGIDAGRTALLSLSLARRRPLVLLNLRLWLSWNVFIREGLVKFLCLCWDLYGACSVKEVRCKVRWLLSLVVRVLLRPEVLLGISWLHHMCSYLHRHLSFLSIERAVKLIQCSNIVSVGCHLLSWNIIHICQLVQEVSSAPWTFMSLQKFFFDNWGNCLSENWIWSLCWVLKISWIHRGAQILLLLLLLLEGSILLGPSSH